MGGVPDSLPDDVEAAASVLAAEQPVPSAFPLPTPLHRFVYYHIFPRSCTLKDHPHKLHTLGGLHGFPEKTLLLYYCPLRDLPDEPSKASSGPEKVKLPCRRPAAVK